MEQQGVFRVPTRKGRNWDKLLSSAVVFCGQQKKGDTSGQNVSRRNDNKKIKVWQMTPSLSLSSLHQMATLHYTIFDIIRIKKEKKTVVL